MPRVLCNRVQVYIFRMKAGKPEFLVLRRAAAERLGGTWQSIHGTIDAGETASQTALREMREETGLIPVRFYQIDSVDTFFIAAEDAICHSPVFAAEVSADAVVHLNEEHDAFEWLDAEAAMRRYLWPGQRRAVREILDEIITTGPATVHLEIKI